MPTASWGALNRVDPVAVALTAYAIWLAGPSWRHAVAAGVLAALAIYTKPTAILPLAAVLAYFVWRDPRTALRVSIGFFIAGMALLAFSLTRFDANGLYAHLVTHNAFPFDPAAPMLLFVLGALVVGAFVAVAFRVGDGRMRAYIIGAAAVVALSGHEGATFNYLLDLSAASCLALTPLARTRPARVAALFTGQLVATFALTLIGPFAGVNLAANAERLEAASGLQSERPHLAEDSGVLMAAGLEPVVDDIFVWARLVSLGTISDEVTPRVRAREFGAVISDVSLEALPSAPAYERMRWPDPLVQAVLEHYQLDRQRPGSYRYVPRLDR
jgi:hypothetical protein